MSSRVRLLAVLLLLSVILSLTVQAADLQRRGTLIFEFIHAYSSDDSLAHSRLFLSFIAWTTL